MKLPKFSVVTKILCASGISSYIAYSYFTPSSQEMATKSCAPECCSRAQKLKIYCPSSKNFMVTGNWKMNGDKQLAEKVIKTLRCGHIFLGNEVVIGIPAPYLDYFQQRKPKKIQVAAQNIYKEKNGPYTGEISADMLVDIGVKWVILGATERRLYFNEDYELIGEKAKYAMEKDLNVILCIGESAEEREKKQHIDVVLKQLETIMGYVPKSKWKQMVLVYEPLWAIGARAITIDEAVEVAKAIRQWLTQKIDEDTANIVRIQIGGPMTIATAREFAKRPEFDGIYVGTHSVKADFMSYINANGNQKN